MRIDVKEKVVHVLYGQFEVLKTKLIGQFRSFVELARSDLIPSYCHGGRKSPKQRRYCRLGREGRRTQGCSAPHPRRLDRQTLRPPREIQLEVEVLGRAVGQHLGAYPRQAGAQPAL